MKQRVFKQRIRQTLEYDVAVIITDPEVEGEDPIEIASAEIGDSHVFEDSNLHESNVFFDADARIEGVQCTTEQLDSPVEVTDPNEIADKWGFDEDDFEVKADVDADDEEGDSDKEEKLQ